MGRIALVPVAVVLSVHQKAGTSTGNNQKSMSGFNFQVRIEIQIHDPCPLRMYFWGEIAGVSGSILMSSVTSLRL